MDLNSLPLFQTTPQGETSSSSSRAQASKPRARRAKKPLARATTTTTQASPSVQARVQAPGPARELTVTELTRAIKSNLEQGFQSVWVKGEISNFRPSAAGHLYFSLKDSHSSVSVAVFGWGRGARKKFDLKDGLEVILHGKVSVYGPRGTYQLIADEVEPLGAGALQLAFEQLKERLQKEGLFENKKPLPSFPKRIAIVTSPSGAAIRDILNVLGRRAPGMEVLILPAIVQGDAAPAQMIRAIELANQYELGEVLVLARGGGSIEDLWCFNDEGLARAMAASKLPIVSGVGHEIDFTICDFVADYRAPTPSAAAEVLSQSWMEVNQALVDLKSRLWQGVRRELSNQRSVLEHISARLKDPRDRLREQSQRVDEINERLERGVRNRLERASTSLERCATQLDALSPLKVLDRGYSIVREGERVLKSVGEVSKGKRLEVTFKDGSIEVEAV